MPNLHGTPSESAHGAYNIVLMLLRFRNSDRRNWASALLVLLVACASAFGRERAAQPGVAAVAAPDSYSTEVAAVTLEMGGNAIDATVATAFALAVTYPEA